MTAILMLAVTIEALVEYAKLIVVNKTVNWKQVAALALGVAGAVLTGADLYDGLFPVPCVGSVLTGVLLSRGANYVADFTKRLQGSNV